VGTSRNEVGRLCSRKQGLRRRGRGQSLGREPPPPVEEAVFFVTRGGRGGGTAIAGPVRVDALVLGWTPTAPTLSISLREMDMGREMEMGGVAATSSAEAEEREAKGNGGVAEVGPPRRPQRAVAPPPGSLVLCSHMVMRANGHRDGGAVTTTCCHQAQPREFH